MISDVKSGFLLLLSAMLTVVTVYFQVLVNNAGIMPEKDGVSGGDFLLD